MTAATHRPLKIGILLPYMEGLDSGHHADYTRRWTELKEMALRAEAIGLDSVWVADHLLFRWPGKEDEPQGIWEGWSLLTGLAAVTSRVEVGILVACTIFRNPALLAKMAATTDEIAGGRLILGLGAGWHEPEFRMFDYPWDHRVSRFEEELTIIARLLREGRCDFEGRYHHIKSAEIRPRGPRPQGPPILIGTTGERMLRLTARHADIWNHYMVWGRSWPDAIPPLRETVDAACAAVGREPAKLARSVTILVNLPEAGAGPTGEGEEPLQGNPEELAEAFRGFAREGISHLQLLMNPNTLGGLEALTPALKLLDRG